MACFSTELRRKRLQNPISVLAAVILLWSYDIDIFKNLVDAISNTELKDQTCSSSNFGRIMTGFLVAGGNGAVFTIFMKFCFRGPGKLAEKARQARKQAMKTQEA